MLRAHFKGSPTCFHVFYPLCRSHKSTQRCHCLALFPPTLPIFPTHREIVTNVNHNDAAQLPDEIMEFKNQ